MNPLQIEMLLHYRCLGGEFRDFEIPAVRKAFLGFIKNGMIKKCKSSTPLNTYKLTERGNVFIDHICNLDIPEIKTEWIMKDK